MANNKEIAQQILAAVGGAANLKDATQIGRASCRERV